MAITFDTYNSTIQDIKSRKESILSIPPAGFSERVILTKILGCIDLTTLEGSDTKEKIIAICNKARSIHQSGDDLPDVAAVCFYPPFIKLAKTTLQGSGVKMASVAGAFPSGQTSVLIKTEEVRHAVDEGADEIDMVISRGKFLEGEYNEVFDEIAAIKQACGNARMKVILETGELQSVSNIRKASEMAILAGADFIKTSTGKISPAATPEAFIVMADTVKEYHDKTGKMIGLKPAGGISTPDQAIIYLQLLLTIAGEKWFDKNYFRIGASRLTDELMNKLR